MPTRESSRFPAWAWLLAAWAAAMAAWRLPFLHWHHFPFSAAAIHLLTYFPLCLLALAGFLHLDRNRLPGVPASRNIGYIPRLDHLRFFAAAMVVLYHYFRCVIPGGTPVRNPVISLISEGSSGVDLFFVLSGFIFGLISYEKKVRYFDFLVSRVARIFPLYLFAIGLAVAASPARFSPADIALMMFPVFEVNAFPAGLPGFGHLWTIGLEFQFYLVFPFLAAFVLRNGRRYLCALLGLAVAIRLLYFSQAGTVRDISYWSMAGRGDQFIVGLLAAWVFVTRREWFSHPLHLAASAAGAWAGLYGLSVWGGYFNGVSSPWWVIWPTIEGVLWAYLIVSYLSCRLRLFPAIDGALTRLGQLSFSIYVMHLFAVVWTQKYLAPIRLTSSREWDGVLGGIVVCLPLALCLAFPTFHLIEKQFFVYRRKYTE